MSSLKNKVILITGASRGLGADIAVALGAEGASIIINYANSANDAETVKTKIIANGGKAITVKANVSKESEVEQLFDEALSAFGRIDVLINNAGVSAFKLIKDYTEADFNYHFDINVKGTFFGLKQAATRLADNGIIINFSSSTTRMMLPSYAVYSASKVAVEQLTRVFAKEIGRGISVNAIAPGPTATELFFTGKTDDQVARLASLNAFNRIAAPADITRVILFLASDQAKWISGQTIFANGAMA